MTADRTRGGGLRALNVLLCVLAFSSLAACDTAPFHDDGGRHAGTAKVPSQTAPPPPAVRARLSTPTPEPITSAAIPAAKSPLVDSDPEKLRGMDSAGLTGLLGRPAFLRRDAPAQLWRYRHKSCVLDLFLYPGAAARDNIEVRHFEARSLSRSPTSPRACLGELLRSRLAKGAG